MDSPGPGLFSKSLVQGDFLSVTDLVCHAPAAGVHDEFSLSYLRDGSLTYRAGSCSFDLVPGAVLVGLPGIEYTCRHVPGGRGECLSFRYQPAFLEGIGKGADLVVETVGPETIEQSIVASARYAEIVLLIWKSANRPDLVLPGDVYGPKLATLRRIFVGSRAELEAMIKAIAVNGTRPVINQVFPFRQLHDAYRHFQDQSRFGKVVISMD